MRKLRFRMTEEKRWIGGWNNITAGKELALWIVNLGFDWKPMWSPSTNRSDP